VGHRADDFEEKRVKFFEVPVAVELARHADVDDAVFDLRDGRCPEPRIEIRGAYRKFHLRQRVLPEFARIESAHGLPLIRVERVPESRRFLAAAWRTCYHPVYKPAPPLIIHSHGKTNLPAEKKEAREDPRLPLPYEKRVRTPRRPAQEAQGQEAPCRLAHASS